MILIEACHRAKALVIGCVTVLVFALAPVIQHAAITACLHELSKRRPKADRVHNNTLGYGKVNPGDDCIFRISRWALKRPVLVLVLVIVKRMPLGFKRWIPARLLDIICLSFDMVV